MENFLHPVKKTKTKKGSQKQNKKNFFYPVKHKKTKIQIKHTTLVPNRKKKKIKKKKKSLNKKSDQSTSSNIPKGIFFNCYFSHYQN